MAAAIPSVGAAATAFALGGSGDGTLNLPRSHSYHAAAGLGDGAPPDRQRHRRLQAAATCVGDFTIVSPLWPTSAGCYEETAENMFEFVAADGTTWIVTSIAMYNSADSPSVWVAGEMVISAGQLAMDPHCHSEGDLTVHDHPADVEFWLCDIGNEGTAYTEVTPEEFSTSCGCAGAGAGVGGTEPPVGGGGAVTTPAPTAAERAMPITPAPVAATTPATPAPAASVAATAAPVAAATPPPPTAAAATTAPVAATPPEPVPAAATEAPVAAGSVTTSETPNGLCGEFQDVEISTTHALLADLEGCYEETGHEYHEEGGHFWTITGSDLKGQFGVFPGYVDQASTDARWFIGFVAVKAEETLVYCVSHSSPAEGHPSTTDWYCDADGSATFPLMEESEFSVSCGCSDGELSVEEATEAPGHGGATTAPVVGGATEPPAHGGATTAPAVGGATEPPAHGGATTAPAVGGATEPPAHGGATTAPAVGGATEPPAHGGATTPPAAGTTSPPAVGGATEPPAHGGATTAPAHGHTAAPTIAPAAAPVAATTAAPAPTVGATLEPIVDGTAAPVAGHTSAGEGHTSDHDAGGHSPTPSPTIVARGIEGGGDTPAPAAGVGTGATAASAATRAADLSAFAARAAAAVGAVVLFAAAV